MVEYAPGRWEIISFKKIRGFPDNTIALDGSTIDDNGCNFFALKGGGGHRAPQTQFVSDPLPNIPGEKLLFVHTQPRDLSIPIAVVGPNSAAVETAMDNLTNAINVHYQVQIKVTNENGHQRVLNCRMASGLEQPETADTRGQFVNIHTIHFTAFDPYWYDANGTFYTEGYEETAQPWLTPYTSPEPIEDNANIKYSKWRINEQGQIPNEAMGFSAIPLTVGNQPTVNTVIKTWYFPLISLNFGPGDKGGWWVPGFKGAVSHWRATVDVPGSSSTGKSATIYLIVDGVPMTGGEIALTSANCKTSGTILNATPITAGAIFNPGSNIDVGSKNQVNWGTDKGYLEA